MKAIHTLALIAAGAVLVTSTPLCASETDDRIESSFSKSYAYKIYLKDDAIKTESRNGVVTLTGQVNEASHKYLAQEAVAGVPGVQRVDNQLEVKLEGTEKSDTWIRAKVRSVLALHRNVSGRSTQVDIRDGVITLRGVSHERGAKGAGHRICRRRRRGLARNECDDGGQGPGQGGRNGGRDN